MLRIEETMSLISSKLDHTVQLLQSDDDGDLTNSVDIETFAYCLSRSAEKLADIFNANMSPLDQNQAIVRLASELAIVSILVISHHLDKFVATSNAIN